MRQKRRPGISTKINLFVGFLIILPMVFLGFFFIRHESRAIEKELNLRGQGTVERFAQGVECQLAFLAGNTRDLELQLGKVLEAENAVYAIAADMNGKILAAAGKKTGEPVREFSAPVITSKQDKENAGIEDILLDADPGNETIGSITLGLSLEDMNLKTSQLRRVVSFVLVVVIAISIAGAVFGIRYLINRPLGELVSGIRTIGSGDLSHRMALTRRDEIGQLAAAFNKMTENLSLLMVSKNYVNNILESMNDILVVISLDGTIKTINRATLNLLGFEEKDLIGQSCNVLLPVEHFLFPGSVLPGLNDKDIIYDNQDLELIKKDGSRLHVAFSATLMYNSSGRIEGIIVVAKDMTSKKHADEERLELERRLQLAEKMEALGRLAGGVAHDLNNTLGAIVGYPDILLRKLPREGPHLKALNAIKQSGLRAAAIVRDLLTLARRGIKVADIINLNQLVREYFISPEFEKLKRQYPDVRIEYKLEEDLLNLTGSPVHLTKTLMNLVTNAAEATQDSGSVTVSTSNRYVEREVRENDFGLQVGEYIVLSVTDTGIGIPPEDLKRIFEPFFSTKTMGRSGTGLGMAVVWGTIKDHNGYLDVKSEVGKGTTFEIFLPATRDDVKDEYKGVVIDEYMGEGEKILVVDDIEAQREISVHLLQTLGYNAEAVSSGEMAVRYLRNQSVDLVLLDMIMSPGIDGLETYNRIHKINPATRVIIASGYSETDRVKQAMRNGVCAYLQKPYTLENVGLAIKSQLTAKAPS